MDSQLGHYPHKIGEQSWLLLARFTVKLLHGASTVYATIAGPTTSGDFTSPTLPLLGCSGNLAALSGATGWFYMDVEGIDTVDIKLAFGADNGTYVIDVGLQ